MENQPVQVSDSTGQLETTNDRSIEDALRRKRAELDTEIELFRKQKELEFKEFEKALRRDTVTAPDDAAADAADGAHTGASSKDALSRVNEAGKDAELVAVTASLAKSGVVREGREWEGVFTPTFLPLIDGHQQNRSDEVAKSSVKGHLPPDRPALSTSSSDQYPSLSSPLLSHLSTTSSQVLSSSAPPREDSSHTHHRSDSSNSNISVASLRSSIKDPRQPKSPKRVLFSLGEGEALVSPSTSPILSKRAVEERLDLLNRQNRGAVATIGNADDDALEIIIKSTRKKKNRRKHRERSRSTEDEDRGRDVTATALDAPNDADHNQTDINDGWDKVNPTRTLRQPLTFQPLAALSQSVAQKPSSDDFESIEKSDGDDLFAFDEDLDDDSSGRLTSNRGATMFHDEDSGLASHHDDLPGTSPHAGSLPIEIKWPQRREGGGSRGDIMA